MASAYKDVSYVPKMFIKLNSGKTNLLPLTRLLLTGGIYLQLFMSRNVRDIIEASRPCPATSEFFVVLSMIRELKNYTSMPASC